MDNPCWPWCCVCNFKLTIFGSICVTWILRKFSAHCLLIWMLSSLVNGLGRFTLRSIVGVFFFLKPAQPSAMKSVTDKPAFAFSLSSPIGKREASALCPLKLESYTQQKKHFHSLKTCNEKSPIIEKIRQSVWKSERRNGIQNLPQGLRIFWSNEAPITETIHWCSLKEKLKKPAG